MKLKALRQITSFLILICLIGVIIAFFHILIKNNKESLKQSIADDISFTSTPVDSYNNDLNLPKKYHFIGTIYNKSRQPIEQFSYKNNLLFLYELPITSLKPLQKLIKINHSSKHPTSNNGYYNLISSFNSIDHSDYELNCKNGIPISANKLNLYLSDTNARNLRTNDTVCSYYVQMGDFSINYDSSDTIDLYGERKFNAQQSWLPLQITFVKKHDHYYLFIMIEKK